MHPRRSAQEVLLCDLCEIVSLQSHCELCNINLCGNCAVKHISDSSKRHNVVHYLQKKSTPNYPKCSKHVEKRCELHCEKCDIPICSTCVSSGKHKGHDIMDILEKFSANIQNLQKDLKELETRIFPRYEEMAYDIRNETTEIETNYGELTNDADQQGEILHREVTAIVIRRKSDIQEMKNKHISTLNENTEKNRRKIIELKQMISDLKSILKSNDISLTSTYKSRNSEFRTLPPKVRVTLPSFSPGKINKDQLNEMFGSLSSVNIYREQGGIIKSPEAVPSHPSKPLRDEPRLTATTDTGFDYLRSVSCLSEEQIWTCGDDKTMNLLNLQGKIQTSIQTKSGNYPQDLAVTRGGDIVYTDHANQTVNLVTCKDQKIRTVIKLQGWNPSYICCTASGDLLVTMISGDREQSKVVRYSGSTETQTIQFDDQGWPLYSSGFYKYLTENRNLDICVSDNKARAIVVVNHSGQLRFRYTGHLSNTEKLFDPHGITTDSQSHILTADFDNHLIHILDQDGQFLRFIQSVVLRVSGIFFSNIQKCDLERPYSLCVDTRDNLYVAERGTAKVKKIQYL